MSNLFVCLFHTRYISVSVWIVKNCNSYEALNPSKMYMQPCSLHTPITHIQRLSSGFILVPWLALSRIQFTIIMSEGIYLNLTLTNDLSHQGQFLNHIKKFPEFGDLTWERFKAPFICFLQTLLIIFCRNWWKGFCK